MNTKYAYKITTELDEDTQTIDQAIFRGATEIHRIITDLKEQHFCSALEELGWTPPAKKSEPFLNEEGDVDWTAGHDPECGDFYVSEITGSIMEITEGGPIQHSQEDVAEYLNITDGEHDEKSSFIHELGQKIQDLQGDNRELVYAFAQLQEDLDKEKKERDKLRVIHQARIAILNEAIADLYKDSRG